MRTDQTAQNLSCSTSRPIRRHRSW
jgi:hypothetical protein